MKTREFSLLTIGVIVLLALCHVQVHKFIDCKKEGHTKMYCIKDVVKKSENG